MIVKKMMRMFPRVKIGSLRVGFSSEIEKSKSETGIEKINEDEKKELEAYVKRMEMMEYEDLSSDYKIDLLKDQSKFAQVFDVNKELLDTRHEAETYEKIHFTSLNFFGIFFACFLIFNMIYFFDRIQRIAERSIPAYKMYFRSKRIGTFEDEKIEEFIADYLRLDQELNLDNCAMYILCIKMMVDKNEMSQDGFNPDFLRKNIGAFVEKITLKSDFYKRVLDYDATLDTLVDALVYLSSIKPESEEESTSVQKTKQDTMKVLLDVEEFNTNQLNFFQKLDFAYKLSPFVKATSDATILTRFRNIALGLSKEFQLKNLPKEILINFSNEDTEAHNEKIKDLLKTQSFSSYNKYLKKAVELLNEV